MTSRLVRLVFVLVPLLGLAMAFGLGAQEDSTRPEQKLQSLLQRRRDTLKTRLERIETMRRIGAADVGDILPARIDLLDAELPLATTKAARIEVLKQRVRFFRELEEIAAVAQREPPPTQAAGRRHHIAKATGDALLAKADTIQAEIDLLREEMAQE